MAEIAVVGAGLMGKGIAQVAATAGYSVRLFDAVPAAAAASIPAIEKQVTRMVAQGRLAADPVVIVSRLTVVHDLNEVTGADFVIEAISEDVGAKTKLLQALDQLCGAETVLASNTSSISITRLAGACSRPERVIGTHFMSPVPLSTVVELVRGRQTSEETFARAVALTEALGLAHIVAKNTPGFIVNRLLVPMVNEAFFLLMEGNPPEAIDAGMKQACNHPQGPLRLADLFGLDVTLAILEVLHSQFGEDKYRPCPLLREYVQAGWLGKKSGRGVYQY